MISGAWQRQLHGPYVVSADRLTASEVVASPALLADPRGTGVRLAQRVLEQFGLDVPDRVLMDWQDQVFNRH